MKHILQIGQHIIETITSNTTEHFTLMFRCRLSSEKILNLFSFSSGSYQLCLV